MRNIRISLWRDIAASSLILGIFGLVGCANQVNSVEKPTEKRSSPEIQTGEPAKVVLSGQGSFDPKKPVNVIIVGNKAFYQGDIYLGDVKYSNGGWVSSKSMKSQSVSLPNNPGDLWRLGIVPYEVDDSVSQEIRGYIASAVEEYSKKTNLKLKKRESEIDYIKFVNFDRMCFSRGVGKQGGVQIVNLFEACTTGNTIHEIGHAIGFWHEQSRNDRDNYVRINYSNIIPKFQDQFNKEEFSQNWGSYDYNSIMHYPSWGFAIDPEIPTIESLDGNFPTENLGQRAGLSKGDVFAVNELYRSAFVNQKPSIGSFVFQKGTEDFSVQFNWSTADPDGDNLICSLDANSDGVIEYTMLCSAGSKTHTYSLAGSYTATLIVSDGNNPSLTKTLAVQVAEIATTISGISAQTNNAIVSSKQTVSLTATVSGTGNFNAGVNWSIVSGGGSLSSTTGLSVDYTAPNVNASTTVKIRATSAGDSSKTADVTLTISVPTAISSVTANANASQLLGTQSTTLNGTVNGTGTFNSNLTWNILSGGGSLSASSGSSVTYTAADITSNITAIIRATSVGDASKTSDVTIQVSPRSVVTGVSVTGNTSLASGAATTLFASVSGSGSYSPSVNWSVVSGGGSVSSGTGSTVTYTAPIVGSNSTAVIRATSAQDASKSGSVSVSIAGLALPDQVCDANWRPTGDFDVWRDDNAGGLNLGAHTENGGGLQYWWRDSSNGSGGNSYFTHANGRDDRPENYAYWAFNVPTSGTYAVYAFIPSANSVNGYVGYYGGIGNVDWRYREPAANVKYQFGTGPEWENQGTTRLNQNNNRGCWAKVGTVNYSGGTSYYVTIQDLVGTAGGYGGKIYYDVLALKRIP
jgi:hypothetical protein